MRAALGVVLLSLAVRVPWAAWATITPVADFGGYDFIAREWLATGELHYVHGDTFRTPGYPLFLAAIYAASGPSPRTVGLIQAVLGGVTSGLIVLLAGRTVSRPAAAAAGLLHALSLNAIVYVPLLASENLALPLLVGSLLALASSHEVTGRRRLLRAALSGGLFSALILTRPGVGTLMAPAFILLALYHPHLRTWSFRVPAGFVLAAGLVFLPWSIRNYTIGLPPWTVSTQGGLALWWEVRHHVFPGAPSYRTGTETLSDQERSVACRRMALEWIRANPRLYAGMCRARLARAVGASADGCVAQYLYPTPENDLGIVAKSEARRDPRESPPDLVQRHGTDVQWRCQSILKPLRTVVASWHLAAVLLALTRWRAFAFSLFPVFSYLGLLVATVFVERYRLPSEALLCIPLGALLTDILVGSRNVGRWRPRIGKAALVVALPLANLYAHTNSTVLNWYTAPPVCFGSPDVSGLTFEAVAMTGPIGSYRWPSDKRVSLTEDDGHLRLLVDAGPKDRAGGLRLAIPPAKAVRLDLSVQNPADVLSLEVSLWDDAGGRVHRWLWRVSLTPWERGRCTYALVPGEHCRYFVPAGARDLHRARQLRIIALVRAGASGGFVLHGVETAPDRPAGSPPPSYEFVPVPLTNEPGAYRSSWINAVDGMHVERTGPGLRLAARAATGGFGGSYCGLRFDIPRSDAFRLGMRLEVPEQVVAVTVDAYTPGHMHVARWTWKCAGEVRPSIEPMTLLFVPGQDAGSFKDRTTGWFSDVRELHVLVQIAPGQSVGLVVTSLESAFESRVEARRGSQ